jgi:hypothetical protein
MFGWFRPKCPLDTWEKTWTELRMRWLADSIGIERLLRARIVLPNEEFFPDPYEGTEADAQRLFERICGFMGADASGLRLEVCEDVQLPGAVGHYDTEGPATIRIVASQLEDPDRLVAALSHEVAHELLLGGGRLTSEVPDHEWVTDLLLAYLGLGVVAANAVMREQTHRVGNVTWWTVSRQGYLPARVFGYALALFAWVRGEDRPEWVKWLRLDAASVLAEGLRFLQKTGDSLFHPDTVRRPLRPRSVGELQQTLREGSPTFRLAALWELNQLGPAAADALEWIVAALHDRDAALRGEAARTLGAIGPAVGDAVLHIVDRLDDREPSVQVAAAQSLGALQLRPDVVVPGLCQLLEQENDYAIFAAATSLATFAGQHDLPTKPILAALGRAVIACAFATADYLAVALKPQAARVEDLLHEEFPQWDQEVRRSILNAVRKAPPVPTPVDVRLPPFHGRAQQ